MNIKQQYSSANTSINSKRLPKIYSLINIGKNTTVLDYGCGKFFDSYNLGDNFYGYDPYNRNNPDVLNRTYDIALCSNVLNVIKEREVRLDVLRRLKGLARKVYITVYEGDRSGKSRVSKEDCYQLNWSRGNYIPELVAVFGAGNVSLKNGMFECINNMI